MRLEADLERYLPLAQIDADRIARIIPAGQGEEGVVLQTILDQDQG